MGFAGHAAARDVLLGAGTDVLLTVGTSLNETATLNWTPELRKNRVFIQLDIDSDRIGRNYPVDVALVGDAQTMLVELVYHLHRLMREGAGGLRHCGPTSRRASRVLLVAASCATSEPGPAHAAALAQGSRGGAARRRHDLLGHRRPHAVEHPLPDHQGRPEVRPEPRLRLDGPRHGARRSARRSPSKGRPVFAIIGDACFTMNGMELVTAAEYGVPVIWIVENNNMHGITWHGSKLVGARVPLASVRYKRPLEVAAIARAMGLAAWVVDAPGQIQSVVQEALAHAGPSLIEVRVDGNIAPPLGDRAKSIAGLRGAMTTSRKGPARVAAVADRARGIGRRRSSAASTRLHGYAVESRPRGSLPLQRRHLPRADRRAPGRRQRRAPSRSRCCFCLPLSVARAPCACRASSPAS